MYAPITAPTPQREQSLTGGERVGDRERDKVVTRLGQAFTQGYLSMTEYEERLAQALEAQTASALNRPISDLPVKRIAQADPRHRAARAANARRGVRIHLLAYLAMAVLTIAIWLSVALSAGAWYFWPVWPILGGGIGMVSHALGIGPCVRNPASETPASERGSGLRSRG
jgi:hypothetical protein